MTAAVGRLAIIGVGLIGGSFARALRAAGRCRSVVGCGRDPRNLERAVALGVIDDATHDAVEAARGADVVLVATPVAQIGPVLAAIAPALAPRAIVTDAGSTKRDVVAIARQSLGQAIGRFVPGHPIAGAESSGVEASRVDLFRGRRVVLTPLEESDAAGVIAVTQLWEACGARVTHLTPQAHDEALAAVSHLPHVLAYALMHEIAARPDAGLLLGHAAGGFRDFTRIASSHPEMWRDICMANRDLLIEECNRFGARLEQIAALLRTGDALALERLFSDARRAREAWLERPPEGPEV